MTVGDEEWKERVRAYNRRQRMLRGVCECGAYYPEEHTARREGVIEGLERAAKIALDVWDSGQSGVHGGEQANRTSDAIRAEIERLKGEQA